MSRSEVEKTERNRRSNYAPDTKSLSYVSSTFLSWAVGIIWLADMDTPSWLELLGYWALPNLQVINRDVHVTKCASEARGRTAIRAGVTESFG